MEQLISSIMERLANQVPELRFIDVDLEQLQLENPPVDFPCALIDISNVNYTSSLHSQQQADVDVSVTLGFSVLAPSSHYSEPVYKKEAMQHYSIITKVAEALHGYETDSFVKLDRVSLSRRTNTYPRSYVLNFKTGYTEILEIASIPVRPTPEFVMSQKSLRSEA